MICQDLSPRCRAAALIHVPACRAGAVLLEMSSLADAQVERRGPKKVSALSDSALLLGLTSFRLSNNCCAAPAVVQLLGRADALALRSY